jgi:hypothetical protein
MPAEVCAGEAMPYLFRRRQLFSGLAMVHVVAAIGMLFALQRWKSRFQTFDLLPHIQSARELLERGRIPMKGISAGLARTSPRYHVAAGTRDDYQIVQSVSDGPEDYRFPFLANLGSHFQPVAYFGSYQVFKRYQPDGEQVRR